MGHSTLDVTISGAESDLHAYRTLDNGVGASQLVLYREAD